MASLCCTMVKKHIMLQKKDYKLHFNSSNSMSRRDYWRKLQSSIEFYIPQGKWHWPYFLGNSLLVHAAALSLFIHAIPERPPEYLAVEYVVQDNAKGKNDDHGRQSSSSSSKRQAIPKPEKTYGLQLEQELLLHREDDAFSVLKKILPGIELPKIQPFGEEERQNAFFIDVDRLGENAAKSPDICNIYAAAEQYPDALYIMIDSSMSMDKRLYSAPAVTCSYRAALSAWNGGALVGVINFSASAFLIEPTRNKQEVAAGISLWQGKATYLPADLEKIINYPRADILIVSDGYIDHYWDALPRLEAILQRQAVNQGSFIPIGDEQNEDFFRSNILQEFAGAGFRILDPEPEQDSDDGDYQH